MFERKKLSDVQKYAIRLALNGKPVIEDAILTKYGVFSINDLPYTEFEKIKEDIYDIEVSLHE